MSRVSAVLLLAGLAFAAMLAPWPAGSTSSFDCRTISPTPTITATPTPPAPWEPYAWVPICNDTGQAVSDLHVRLVRSADNEDPIGANAPGCPEPAYFYDSSPSYTTIDIDWGTHCVQPGEMVTLYFYAGCTTPEPGCSPPHASCYYWTADGAPVPSASPAVNPWRCADPSPIATATPQPTGPCPSRGPPPPDTPPAVTPPPETIEPGSTWRDMIFSSTVDFCNETGEAVSDLHVDFAYPFSNLVFKANPSGCPEPSFTPEHPSLDQYYLDVDWGDDCVDQGEVLTIDFYFACGTNCHPPQPYCYTWTRFGEPVYQGEGDCLPPTPTPTASPSPPLTPTVTPTPTPIGPVPEIGQGDANCTHRSGEGGGVNAVDALGILVYVAGLPPLPQNEPCPDVGEVAANGIFGDVDCSGEVTSADALAVLRYVARLLVSQHQPCPPVGAWPATGT